MNTEITFTQANAALIGAMAKYIAPAKDIRDYLRGVWLETYNGQWVAMATDGHVLTASAVEQSRQPEGFAVFLPRDFALLLMQCKKTGARLAFTEDARAFSLTLTIGIGEHKIEHCQDFQIPEWRRIVPQDTSGEPGQFNPLNLDRIDKVASALSSVRRYYPGYVRHNGERAALLVYPHDLIGVCMPMRSEDCSLPEWFTAQLQVAA